MLAAPMIGSVFCADASRARNSTKSAGQSAFCELMIIKARKTSLAERLLSNLRFPSKLEQPRHMP
jgi:hypothetical protein